MFQWISIAFPSQSVEPGKEYFRNETGLSFRTGILFGKQIEFKILLKLLLFDVTYTCLRIFGLQRFTVGKPIQQPHQNCQRKEYHETDVIVLGQRILLAVRYSFIASPHFRSTLWYAKDEQRKPKQKQQTRCTETILFVKN